MPTTQELFEQAESLPVEDRAMLVDSLLRTLNQPDPAIDREWAAVAEKRLQELRDGKVEPIPAEDVFAEARKRLGE